MAGWSNLPGLRYKRSIAIAGPEMGRGAPRAGRDAQAAFERQRR